MSLQEKDGIARAPGSLASRVLAALLGVAMIATMAGCKSTGNSGDSDQAGGASSNGSGSSGSGGGQAGGAQGGGSQGKQGGGATGGAGSQLAEPVDSTTGTANADSDDGSTRAVGHTSTAMPGAPQSTMKGSQQDRKLDSPESPGSPKAGSPPPPQ